MNLGRVQFSYDILARILRLPAEARIVACRIPAAHQTIELEIEHPAFPEAKVGEPLAIVQATVGVRQDVYLMGFDLGQAPAEPAKAEEPVHAEPSPEVPPADCPPAPE